jgi:phasin family protein
MTTAQEKLMQMQAEALDASREAASKTIEGLQKLAQLNLQTARQSLEQSSEQINALLAARDTRALTDLVTSLARPPQDQFSAYARAVYSIYRDTNQDFAAMVEKQVAASNRQLAEAVETLASNAPAGSDGVVSLIKQSMAAAQSAYDQVNQATRKFADMTEANISNLGKAATGTKKRG